MVFSVSVNDTVQKYYVLCGKAAYDELWLIMWLITAVIGGGQCTKQILILQ